MAAANNNNAVDKLRAALLAEVAQFSGLVPMPEPHPLRRSEKEMEEKEKAGFIDLLSRYRSGVEEQVEWNKIPTPTPTPTPTQTPTPTHEHEESWSSLPSDMKVNILERCSFNDVISFYVAVGKDSSKVPYNTMKIPADTAPLLLHHCDKTFKFYDPWNNVTFVIDRPENSTIGTLCDFWQQKLVTARPEGVALMNMHTGKEFFWEMSTMLSDCYIISPNGHHVNAVVGTKGEVYDTTVAILRQRKKNGKPCMNEVSFKTDVPFTVSQLTNPILRGNKLFCLSTDGELGQFDLENKVAIIYGEQEDNHEDNEDDTDDNDDHDDDNNDGSGDDDKFYSNIFKNRADFLCARKDELFSIVIHEGWGSVQVKKLEEPDMNWQDVNSLGDKAIFTGTRCSIITTVPAELQNKVFLPGYYRSPLIVKAELTVSEGRFFFEPKEISGMGSTSSSGGGDSHGKRSNRVELPNSLWIQLNSFKQ